MHDPDEPNPFAPRPGEPSALPTDITPVRLHLRPVLERAAQLVLNDPNNLGAAFALTAAPMVLDGFLHRTFIAGAHAVDLPWLTAIVDALGLGFDLVGVAATLVLAVGLQRMALLASNGQPVHLNQLLEERATLLPAALAAALMMGGTALGIGFLVLPGLIFAAGTCLTLPILVDRDLPPLDALKASWALTEGKRVDLLIHGGLVVLGVMFLNGLLAGWLATLGVPLFVVLTTVAYQAIGHERFVKRSGW